MRYFLLLLLLTTPLLTAQQGSRTCRLIFLNASQSDPREIFLFDGKTSQKVVLPRMNLSPVYKIAGGNIVLSASQTEITSAEEINPQAPQVAIREGVKDVYLLVGPDKNNSIAPINLNAIPANRSQFANGEMMWFNLTDNAIGGMVGSQKLVMKPRSQKIVKAPLTKKGDFVVELDFQIPNDKNLFPLCETKWFHNPAARKVIFVTMEAGRRAPRVRGFTDFRSPKKAAE